MKVLPCGVFAEYVDGPWDSSAQIGFSWKVSFVQSLQFRLQFTL